MRRVLVFIVLFAITFVFAQEYKIIRANERGEFVLNAEEVKLLVDYILKLEALNENYKQQISVLEKQVANLQEQIKIYEAKLKEYEERIASLTAKEKLAWVVVGMVVVGSVIFLFVR